MYTIEKLIEVLNHTNDKLSIFLNSKTYREYKLSGWEYRELINQFLSEEEKVKILLDKNFITNVIKMDEWDIGSIIETLSSDQIKLKFINLYQLSIGIRFGIIRTFSQENRIKILLDNSNITRNLELDIIQSLDAKKIIDFFAKNRTFFMENNIHLFQVVIGLSPEKQKEIVELLLKDEELTLNEKKEVFAILSQEIKENIDRDGLPEEYAKAMSLKKAEQGLSYIQIDFDRNMEDYKGLDNLIRIDPEQLTERQRQKFIELCGVCPRIVLINPVYGFSTATSSDYAKAEQWITLVLNKLKPEYSVAQKVAIIDNEIGKKISYTPDFDTEVFDRESSCNLFKVIASGYGICAGIAKVEGYILNRIGVENEIASSGKHAFIKLKNIELPLANGQTIRGNTIIDPTWNLSYHKFGAKPNYFCISYEQIRKYDISITGEDGEYHKNDQELQDATIGLDEQSLRRIFMSVGLADKNGQFPLKELVEESEMIDSKYSQNPIQNISSQFLLLSRVYPEFAIFQNSSMSILSDLLLNNRNLRFNRCVVNRVYEKNDREKKPIMYVYVDLGKLGKIFAYGDKKQCRMVQLTQEEFVKRFECYQMDLKKSKGIRPWECQIHGKEDKDSLQELEKVSLEESGR